MVISVQGTFRRLALMVDGTSCPNVFVHYVTPTTDPAFCKRPFGSKDLTRHPQNYFPAPVRNQQHAYSLPQVVI